MTKTFQPQKKKKELFMSRCVDKQLEHIRSSRCISLSSNWILKLSFKSSVPRSFSGDSWVSLTNEVLLCSKTDALAEDLLSPAHTLLRSLKAAAVVATAFTPPALTILTSAAAVISSEVGAASAVVAAVQLQTSYLLLLYLVQLQLSKLLSRK